SIWAITLPAPPVPAFTSRGFPPHKPAPRRRFLQIDEHSPHTLVFYESPHRLKAFLEDALSVFGNREAALANDLTKLFEAVHRGTLSQLRALLDETEPRGEYTVVIAGAGALRARAPRQGPG